MKLLLRATLFVLLLLSVLYALHLAFEPQPLTGPVSNNELQALEDIREVVAAQSAYARDNEGSFASLHCLIDPVRCGAKEGTPPYLKDKNLAVSFLKIEGYERKFHAGANAPNAPREHSLANFVYEARPLEYNKTGIRSFAGDDSGQICATDEDAEVPGVSEGKLRSDCRQVN